jgi:D-arabinan exo alpha-(1,3)/(1,5)-arabinofuranosidase (non-reducing end)
MENGYNLDSIFNLQQCRSKRVSSYDISGGNHDWIDIPAGDTVVIADIKEAGIIRHIWCTQLCAGKDFIEEPAALRKLILRMYWDDEESPSVEAPLGDFFGMGFGQRKIFCSEPLSMGPQDGRSMNCYFPMPFLSGAKITIQSLCEKSTNFYYYIDYEADIKISQKDQIGYFHARFNRDQDTAGAGPRIPGLLDREKAHVPDEPEWYPALWLNKNTTGDDNYTILEAHGAGKYIGCNLNIDVFNPQCNDWYGEGDDMIFIDGESWPPSLHGTGTEDYFNTAFCPTEEFSYPNFGLTLYSGNDAGFLFGGKNSMYRYHIKDPIHFRKSIRVTIEHGHANLLSNDYSSTAYWYQQEPHTPFGNTITREYVLPRINAWEKEARKMESISSYILDSALLPGSVDHVHQFTNQDVNMICLAYPGEQIDQLNDESVKKVFDHIVEYTGKLSEISALINVSADTCIVISGSKEVIEAAGKSGMKTIAIGDPQQLFRANFVVGTLSELSIKVINRLFLQEK